MNLLPKAVPEKLAEEYSIQMSKADLVFINEKNVEKLRTVIDPMVMAEKEKELELKRQEAMAPARLPVKEEVSPNETA